MNQIVKAPLRALSQDKVYSAINVIGLALGIACFIVLILYLRHDLTFDTHHDKRDRIYRVAFEWSYSAGTTLSATSSYGLGPLLKRSYPEIEDYVRFLKLADNRVLVEHESLAQYEQNIYVGDNSTFSVFDIDIVNGNAEKAITEPNTVAISQSMAARYFGSLNPVGKTIKLNDNNYRIDLVFADLPDNSHLKFQAIITSVGKTEDAQRNMWSVGDGFTYVLLHRGNENLGTHYVHPNFFDDHMASTTRDGGYFAKLLLEPLSDIHLYSTASSDLPRGNIAYLYAFGAAAVFVLLVAVINYVNLATARASKRSKEIGMRKVLGASRQTLVASYLLESLVFSLLALLLAIGLVESLFKFTPIAGLLGKQLQLNLWTSPGTWLILTTLGLGTGLLAGIYPAIYLSALGHRANTVKQNASKGLLREGLVLLQFTVSISVIAGTLLMLQQMRYINSKPLGFAKENRLSATIYTADAIERLPALMQEMRRRTDILQVSQVYSSPWEESLNGAIEVPRGDTLHSMEVYYSRVDENFLDTMQIDLLAGRNLDPGRDGFDQERNSISVLVNRVLADEAEWSDPVGESFKIGNRQFNVVGLVEDFHFTNFHQAITPYFLVLDQFTTATMNEDQRRNASKGLLFNITDANIPATLKYIEDMLYDLNPNRPPEIQFLDDTLNNLYVNDQRQMRLIGIFATICIAIACLGLFGLTAFTTQTRTKEIGIRKTLGAGALQLILMLFKRISVLVIVGAVIASAIAFYGIQFWLDSFYYRDQINPLVFPLATAGALAVAFVTVALQANKTVQANPCESLRYE